MNWSVNCEPLFQPKINHRLIAAQFRIHFGATNRTSLMSMDRKSIILYILLKIKEQSILLTITQSALGWFSGNLCVFLFVSVSNMYMGRANQIVCFWFYSVDLFNVHHFLCILSHERNLTIDYDHSELNASIFFTTLFSYKYAYNQLSTDSSANNN